MIFNNFTITLFIASVMMLGIGCILVTINFLIDIYILGTYPLKDNMGCDSIYKLNAEYAKANIIEYTIIGISLIVTSILMMLYIN